MFQEEKEAGHGGRAHFLRLDKEVPAFSLGLTSRMSLSCVLMCKQSKCACPWDTGSGQWVGFPAVCDTPLREPTAARELRHNYSIPLLKAVIPCYVTFCCSRQ